MEIVEHDREITIFVLEETCALRLKNGEEINVLSQVRDKALTQISKPMLTPTSGMK